jgi:hypothetical protein
MLTKDFASRWAFVTQEELGAVASPENVTDDLGGLLAIDIDEYIRLCQRDESPAQI